MGRTRKFQKYKTKRQAKRDKDKESDSSSEGEEDETELPKAGNQSFDDVEAAGFSPRNAKGGKKDKKTRHKSADAIHSAGPSSQPLQGGYKGKKGKNKSVGDIQAEEYSPQNMKGRNKGKKGNFMSTEDFQAADYSPQTRKGRNMDKKARHKSVDYVRSADYASETFHEGNKENKDKYRGFDDIQKEEYSQQTVKGRNKDKECLQFTSDIQATGYSPQAEKGGNKDKESVTSTSDIQATGYSPQAVKGGNKNKESFTSTGNIKARGDSPQAMKGGNKDKVSPKSSGNIHATEKSSQALEEANKDKKSLTPTSSVRTVKQGSDIGDCDLDDEELVKTLHRFDESLKAYKEFQEQKQSKYFPAGEYKFILGSLSESQSELNEYFKNHNPKLGQHINRSIGMLKEMHLSDSPVKNTVTTEGSSVTQQEISELKSSFEDLKVETKSDYNDDSDDSIINLETDEEKEKSNDEDRLPENIQKAMHSPQDLVEGKKDEKGNKCIDNILKSRSSKLEQEMKQSKAVESSLDVVKEKRYSYRIGEETATAISNIKAEKGKELSKELSELLDEQAELSKELAELVDKETELSKESAEMTDEEIELSKELAYLVEKETEFSKELAEQTNDRIKILEMVSGEKEITKCETGGDISADCIQPTKKFPHNATEVKKDEKKVKKDSEGSNEDIQVFHPDQDLHKSMSKKAECMKKGKANLKDKDSNASKSKTFVDDTKRIRSGDDFLHEIKDFLMLQNSKLDEQAEVYSQELETKGSLKQDRQSQDTESATAIEETEIPTERQYEAADRVETSDILDADKNEIVVRLERDKSIHFEVEINGDKHIQLGEDYFFNKKEDKQDLHFGIKEKNINVCFVGSQIFISTENSEFEISVRDPHPADLTDDATQTDSLQ